MDKLLLHVCCGPCSTATLKKLKNQFRVTGFFYNPNIFPNQEKEKRKYYSKQVFKTFDVDFLEQESSYKEYLSFVKGTEKNENKERCKACYRLRLTKTAQFAKENKFNKISTTLLISPYQNLEEIKLIGEEVAKLSGVDFYFEDFRVLFNESRLLSREMNLYRQNYCGCEFSQKPKKLNTK